MDLEKWKKLKRSGAYRRKVKKRYEAMIPSNSLFSAASSSRTNIKENKVEGSVELFLQDFNNDTFDENFLKVNLSQSYNESFDENDSDLKRDMEKDEFRNDIATWALENNITHCALNKLFKIVNKIVPNSLPTDARTLLKSNKVKIKLIEIDNGRYWHNGLIEQLTQYLQRQSVILNNKVSLNINIDGLPVYKSSNQQFWPILCNVSEIKELSPFVIGIYEGKTEPLNLDTYLQSFISEAKQLEGGLKIIDKTGVEKMIEVKIRAFICDSPARALIKGVMNFNAKHGCTKCTVLGEYSHISHTVTFQSINCPKRNNADFREKKYGNHHKINSPLLELNVDMIEDFPVSDSLHLIDLGVMKRLISGWKNGNFGKYITKWSNRDIERINSFLSNCHLPNEIHRAVRQLDVLAYWKGSEYRSFLYYLSPVLLNHLLISEAYHHYLCFYCAIMICSNQHFFQFLRLAEELLKYFVTHFHDFYGKDYITSNIHNLCHVVDEVRRFGILQSFNAYPFENKLQMIKSLLRQGNKPLEQVAKRLLEKKFVDIETYENKPKFPFLKEKRCKNGKIMVLHLESFMLSPEEYDKWFLTNDNQIIETTTIYNNVSFGDNVIRLKGKWIKNVSDAFEQPIKSSLLNIYKCDLINIKKAKDIELSSANIQCKLVSVQYETELYFIPLLHSL